MTCSVGSLPKIWLGQGLHAGGTSTAAVPVRRMINGATNFLSYQLYQEALRTNVWGGTDGSSPAALPALGITAGQATIYGRVPINPTGTVGAYTDTVVATVSF